MSDPEPSDQAPELVVSSTCRTRRRQSFAMGQKLIGSMSCDVQVAKEFEGRAKEVLAAAKEAGAQLDGNDSA